MSESLRWLKWIHFKSILHVFWVSSWHSLDFSAMQTVIFFRSCTCLIFLKVPFHKIHVNVKVNVAKRSFQQKTHAVTASLKRLMYCHSSAAGIKTVWLHLILHFVFAHLNIQFNPKKLREHRNDLTSDCNQERRKDNCTGTSLPDDLDNLDWF